jgi:hypothetical protein
MDRKTAVTYLLILFLLFVALGDQFLPKPLSTASRDTRISLNNFFIGLFPKKIPKLNPNERTEKELQREEKQGTGN